MCHVIDLDLDHDLDLDLDLDQSLIDHSLIDHSIMTSTKYHKYQNHVSVNSNWVHLPGNPWGLAQKTCPGGRDLTFESFPGAGNSTRTGILWKMKVKLRNSEK